jgi:hypothetical protein
MSVAEFYMKTNKNITATIRTSFLLGAFVNLVKATINFFMSVRQSAPDILARTGPIFIKFCILVFSKKICRENSSFIQIWREY